MIYVSAQRFPAACQWNLNKTPRTDTRQTAPRPPRPWPHGNLLSITCSVCLVLPSLCHSPLIYSRGGVPNEWFVRFGSGWFTPGCDQRVLSPRRPLTAWNWDQASSSSSSNCSGSHKLGASFVSCVAPFCHTLTLIPPHSWPPHSFAWLETNLTPSSLEKTDLQGSLFFLLFFTALPCIQEDNRKC